MASASYNNIHTPSQWHVFLSFRGIDTRCTFTGHLHAALDRIFIRTFMDDPELRKGEVISDALFQAIKDAKTYVVVFSENYASSRWCLDELVEIQSKGRLVLPVFYNVEPSAVRKQEGTFNQAFENHKSRFDMHRLLKWRTALTEVGKLKGYNISKNLSEADIIHEIVDRIENEIYPKTLYVAKYPVGLDSRVESVTTLMRSDPKSVIRIGLHGMGGVGKTTLAKEVYNKNYLRFKGSCFLPNVRENSGTEKGLIDLQQKLINDVLKYKNVTIDSVDQGIAYIKDRFCSTKVLIIIDDLDDPKLLEYLGPLALGSIIIITTRNEDLLDAINVEARYKVNELSDAESRQLFAQHAFGNDKISHTFTELTQIILERAGGLPLALKFFGSNLLNQSDEEWRRFIDASERVSMNTVEEKLEISFDGLKLVDPVLQDIFLDLACFFIGRKKEEVVQIMETCYTFVYSNIDILKKRCLLTVDNSDYKLGMHQLLRDMGRKIVRKNSPREPGKHSRLWISKDICNVLKRCKGTEVIEGIIPQNLYYEDSLEGVSFSTDTFKKMSKLRFLYLENVNLTGSFQQKFEILKFLRWKCCPLKCLPSEFYPEELVILELPHSKMINMWELNMDSQVFENLKTLNMSYSLDLTTTLDFTKLRCLETLNLEGCKSLEEVHISIGSSVRLVSLNFCGCVKLKSLPDTICNLRALEIVRICGCISLEALPISLGSIESLKVLDAKGLSISKLPDSMEHLSKLVELDLSYNKKLETLPYTVYNLKGLKSLHVSGCEKLEILPDQLCKITRLRELHASGATMLKELPETGSSHTALSLEMLDLFEGDLISLPSGISQLSKLENLYLRDCWCLLSIVELPPNLKSIWANGCTSMKRLPDLCNLKHLEMLDLTNCNGLTEIQGLEELTSLRELHLGGCNLSLLESTLTKSFFQMYTGFGQQINIYAPLAEFVDCNNQSSDCNSQAPDWISHWNSESNSRSSNSELTMCFDLPSNVSHDFLGMILCFELCEDLEIVCGITLKNTPSDTKWSDSFSTINQGSCMVIVPRSIFAVRDGDDRIELTANSKILGIHLMYQNEHNSTKFRNSWDSNGQCG